MDTLFNLGIEYVLSLGKQVVHKNFPRDFEYYMMAIELVDEYWNSIDYFVFPVMPSAITKQESEMTSIQHTLGGIVVTNKTGFTPKDITISGNFGRGFKFINYEGSSDFESIAKGFYFSKDIQARTGNPATEFPFGIKTGYGCIKILQSIIEKSKARGVEEGSFKLLLYNPALGESYLVVPTKNPLSLSQNEQSSNMIWQYNMSLTIIADLDDITVKPIGSPSDSGLGFTMSPRQILGSLNELI